MKYWVEGVADDAHDDVGLKIVFPAAIKAELDTVETAVKQLDADIMASAVRKAFKDAWRLFVSEWQTFHKSHESWWSRQSGMVYDKTTEYRRRVDEWREAFGREGGQATGPAAVTKPEPTSGSPWRTALIVAGGLVVVGAIAGRTITR